MPLGKLLGIPASNRSYEDDIRLALNKCQTGLEFECENVRVDLPVEGAAGYWETDKDGSLRGNGIEFILREPLFGKDLIESVFWFCNWAKENKFEANYRTGLHVHIDMRNADSEMLISMLVYYALFEPIIYRWVGDDREGSIFCMPFYKAEGAIQTISNALKATSRMKEYMAKVDRYAGLNLNALSKFGSVEWRHMRCTFDPDRIIKWINVCQSFKKYARKFPLKPVELLQKVSQMGPEGLFEQIVGAPLAREFWYAGAHRDVWSTGLPIAQDILNLLEADLNLKWDTVRQSLRAGTNPAFIKWADKAKTQKQEEVPENLFLDPVLLQDPALVRIAMERLRASIREALDNAHL